MNDSRYGTRTENSSLCPSGVPIVKTENDAGACVSQIASAAAIFIGCCSVITLACRSPVTVTPTPKSSATTNPIFSDSRMTATCCLRYRCQALIPMTNAAAVRNDAVATCG